MAFAHGWSKLTGFSQMVEKFPDPIGIGAQGTVALAIFAEFFCGIAVTLGVATRVAAFFPFATMIVAFFQVHAADPFRVKELAFVYGLQFLALMFTGPGAFSLDSLLCRVKKAKG